MVLFGKTPLLIGQIRHPYRSDEGQVIADGTPETVRANPHVATAYLGDEVLEPSMQRGGAADA